MIESSQAYQEAITGDSRRVFFRAILDLSDPDLVIDSITSSPQSEYSRSSQLTDKEFDHSPYRSLEPGRWVLDGSRIFAESLSLPLTGWVGEELSDNSGSFGNLQWCEIHISSIDVLQALSIYFSTDEYDGLPADFTVKIMQGGTAYHTLTVTDNVADHVDLKDFTVYNPDTIRVEITKMTTPQRRARIAEVIFGIYERWTGRDFAGIDIKMQGDVSNLSMPYGTCRLAVNNADRRFEPRRKDNLFQSIEEKQGIECSLGVVLADGGIDWKKLGVFYQYAEGWRTSDNGLTITWDLVDIVGLLAGRDYIPPATLPTTLSGWVESLVSQLGVNFSSRYKVDPNYASVPLSVRNRTDLDGITCGDMFRYVCMAAGCWGRADASTGFLTAEPQWNAGNKITLDNLNNYPVMKANDDIAAIIFELNDGAKTQVVVSGNNTASARTQMIKNPFIKTEAQALAAARMIIGCFGGNQLELTGRGDMSSEIGDVDTVWLDEQSATTARRIEQSFDFGNGVLVNCKSRLLQSDGAFVYQNREVLTESGSWTAPAGVTSIRVILVGGGNKGGSGEDGGWGVKGASGANGAGGKVWSATFNINPQQNFTVSIGAGGMTGGNTTFGAYSSANGQTYDFGFTDIATGDSFARSGVAEPKPNSGDGGKGGKGGRAGRSHTATDISGGSHVVVDREPGSGKPGVDGASGCVVIYYDKPGG